MVGLQAGKAIAAGCDLSPALPPLAAALSHHLLSSRCASCFRPLASSLPTSHIPPSHPPLRCTQACQGAVAYCTQICLTSDLSIHHRSGECHLFSIVRDGEAEDEAGPRTQPPKRTWVGRTSFSELGGILDVRLALRLLLFHQDSNNLAHFSWKNSSRIGVLLSNRSILLKRITPDSTECQTNISIPLLSKNEDLELALQIREASLLMKFARESAVEYNARNSDCRNQDCWSFPLEVIEEVLCQVLTNGVQVQIDEWSRLGFGDAVSQHDLLGGVQSSRFIVGSAVYGSLFSWLNHSCRPNASYSFGYADSSQLNSEQDWENLHELNKLVCEPVSKTPEDVFPMTDPPESSVEGLKPDQRGAMIGLCNVSRGPCVFVHSILPIAVGEEVSITYVDLLKPKMIRQSELWGKYCFQCECPRCCQVPISYCDEVLKAVSHCFICQNSFQPGSSNTCRACTSQLDKAVAAEKYKLLFLEHIDNVISAFMSYDDLRTCCDRLEQFIRRHVCPHSETLLHATQEVSLMDSGEGIKDQYGCGCGSSTKCRRRECSKGSSRECEDFCSFQLNEKSLKLSFMHHACLDGYMALAYAYKVLANQVSLTGIPHLKLDGGAISEKTPDEEEEPQPPNEDVYDGDGQKNFLQNASYYRAAAAYAVLLASIVQNLFCTGEYGLVFQLVSFWIDAVEALLKWALLTDSRLQLPVFHESHISFLKPTSILSGGLENDADTLPKPNSVEMGLISSVQCGPMKKHSNTFDKTRYCNISNHPLYGLFHSMQHFRDFIPLLCDVQASVEKIWPLLKCHSPFLESILLSINCKWHEKCSSEVKCTWTNTNDVADSANSKYLFTSSSVEHPLATRKPGKFSSCKKRIMQCSEFVGHDHLPVDKSIDFSSHVLKSRRGPIILCVYHCLHLTENLLHGCYGQTHPLVQHVEQLMSLVTLIS